MLEQGFKGKIYPINPKYEAIEDIRCYPSIESLPESPDQIVIAVAAEKAAEVLAAAGAKGIRAAVVLSAGFAELGTKGGKELQMALRQVAERYQMAVAGPNCMGLANLDSNSYSTFTSIFRSISPSPEPRDTAILTQSGSVSSALYLAGRQMGVRFNFSLNTGNEACIEYAEYLEYLADRDDTKVVVGYLESIRDRDRFKKIAIRFRNEKRPIIMLKAGVTAKGKQITAAHTAAISGNKGDDAALFAEAGVITAVDIAHAADLAYLARFKARTSGARVAIFTNSGAIAALMADIFVVSGLDINDFSSEIQKKLRSGVPPYGMVFNPVDFTGNIVNNHQFGPEAIQLVLESGEADFAVLYASGFLIDRMADGLIDVTKKRENLISIISTGVVVRQADLEDAGIPVFDDLGRGTRAISSYILWKEGGSG